jgi:hypothetical protein
MNAAFRNVGPAVVPGTVSVEGTRNLVRLLSLDAVTIDRTRLICRWHRDLDGRLSCHWEPEAISSPPIWLLEAGTTAPAALPAVGS